MKIVSIVPGFGGTFYCGNCLRDSVFASSLKQSGHQAVILPVYLPLTMNGNTNNNDTPVFYGAVNIYLKQNYPIFRNLPAWLENFFNSAPILRYAAKKAGSTRAKGLEEMTISMLNGIEGFQSDELRQMVTFLKEHEKPDVVHLSNALLLGMVKHIKEELKVPVVCSLQDEDVWVDAMDTSYKDKLWQLLSEKAKDVDAFVSVSGYFAKLMKSKMKIPDEKIHIVHIGIDPMLYEYSEPVFKQPAIGYVSRMYKDNGFEILIDAFIELKSNPAFSNLKLKLTGGKTADDGRFFNQQMKKLRKNNIIQDVEVYEDFSLNGLKKFFKEITVLSVPVIHGEAFGLYQLEALASGIPIVQPHLGAFPEIVDSTKGGVTYSPNTSSPLAKKLHDVLVDHDKLISMSINGRNAVIEKFDCKKLTGKMINVYELVTKKQQITEKPDIVLSVL